MLNLLRKVRRKLMKETKITTYLLYAIGEIVLVVVGILIAVSIDNWNSERLDQRREQVILKNLNQEFQRNRIALDSIVRHHQTIREATAKLMTLIGEPEEILQASNVDSLIYLALDYADYSPSQSVISELISSGKMNLISSDSLRLLIFEWASAMADKEESYRTMDDISQAQTLPYLTNNGSMKNIDFHGILKQNGRSKFKPKNHQLFQEVLFENHLDNQAWAVTNYLNRLQRLEEIIDPIIKESEIQEN